MSKRKPRTAWTCCDHCRVNHRDIVGAVLHYLALHPAVTVYNVPPCIVTYN